MFLLKNQPGATSRQAGFIHYLGLFFILILSVGLIIGVNQVQKQSITFPKAQTTGVPDARACLKAIEDDFSKSVLKNGSFDEGFSGDLPTGWTKFGNASFSQETGGEKWGVAGLLISGSGAFNAGVYQKASVNSGTWYHAFYATAQQVSGESSGGLPTVREVGIDPNGGTDPNAPSVVWGAKKAGGQRDKDAKRYGGWKTLGSDDGNGPLLTFQAKSSQVTYFIKVSATADSGFSKTWVDSLFLSPDCGSGKTTSAGSGSSGSGSTTASGGTLASSAPSACDPSKISLKIDPANASAGTRVTLNMTNTNGEGTTRIEDELINLENCEDNMGLGANFDNPIFWPKAAKYKTCTVKATPFKWTHKWKNCYPNRQDCTVTSTQCSKSFDNTTGEEPSKPIASSAPPASVGPRPANLQQAIQTEFGITMNNYSQRGLEYAYDMFKGYKSTKFNDLIKGTVVRNTPPSNEAGADSSYCQSGGGPGIIVLDDFADKKEFVLKLTHELGHIIFSCQEDPLSKRTEHERVWTEENGITPYGRANSPSCEQHTWPPVQRFARGEDYAEMIAFYLNQDAKDQYRGACSSNEAPFKTSKYPRHLDLARRILTR